MGSPDPSHFPPYAAVRALEKITNAAAAGDLDTVKRLVTDENYHPTPNYLSRALSKAIPQHLPTAAYLLSAGAEMDRAFLAVASVAKSLPVFEMMVNSGWDVNAPMFGGRTMLASVIESPALVEWFLEHGADPNLGPSKMGTSVEATPIPDSGLCLYEAAASSSIEVVEMLVRAGAKAENSTPLHAAVRRGANAIPMLRYLLSLSNDGIDINGLADPCDQFSVGTPLESVIRHGVRSDSVAIARFLLENGADPRPGGRPGIDAFDEPVRMKLEEVRRRAGSERGVSQEE